MFPDTLSVTVVGSFLGPDGAPVTGYVYYEPTVKGIVAGTPAVGVRCEGRMEVSETGEVRGIWLDPNAAGISPGGWNYKVIEAFHGCDTSRYTVSIPTVMPPDRTFDLNKLERVLEPPIPPPPVPVVP